MSDLDREALKARAEADSSPRDAADQDEDEPRNTVFVKNLSFDTTDGMGARGDRGVRCSV
jgi:hypothetical protein